MKACEGFFKRLPYRGYGGKSTSQPQKPKCALRKVSWQFITHGKGFSTLDRSSYRAASSCVRCWQVHPMHETRNVYCGLLATASSSPDQFRAQASRRRSQGPARLRQGHMPVKLGSAYCTCVLQGTLTCRTPTIQRLGVLETPWMAGP